MKKNTTALILTNIGTPDEASVPKIRNFLKRFLSDPKVVELPRILWLTLLYCLILPLRSRKKLHDYQSIWTQEGSPLFVQTKNLTHKLDAMLADRDVFFGFSYSTPLLDEKIEHLMDEGYESIEILPLFPQRSGTTTGSALSQVMKPLMRARNTPNIAFISGYHDFDPYIDLIAHSIKNNLQKQHQNPQSVHHVFVFHSAPVAYLQKGDPYEKQCIHTANLLAQKLELEEASWTLCYQSQFGKGKWLGPVFFDVIADLARQGKMLSVVSAGFACDCLETLEEIDIDARQRYHGAFVPLKTPDEAGTKTNTESTNAGFFAYIKAPGDSDAHAAMLAKLVQGDGQKPVGM